MKRASITEELAYGNALDRLTGESRKETVLKRRQRAAPPRQQPIAATGTTMIKLSVFLNREEDGYLESLASAAKFSGGKKISKTRLIEAMVQAFRQSKLDVRGVRTDDELYRRVIAQMRK
ncbi:MAG: hypothetical protein ABIK32_01945 [Chloroflexota bacterium]|nr:hypothetical protein [Chloroflexota bacterium]